MSGGNKPTQTDLRSILSEDDVRPSTTNLSQEDSAVTIAKIKSDLWRFLVVVGFAGALALMAVWFLSDIYPTATDEGKSRIIIAVTTLLSGAFGIIVGRVSK